MGLPTEQKTERRREERKEERVGGREGRRKEVSHADIQGKNIPD